MRSQKLKDIYYASIGKLSIISYLWHKKICPLRSNGVYLNLGCGPKYVPGMVNIDGNIFCKKDIWLDMTLGLPFPRNSINGIYSSHVVEHFSMKKAKKLFGEFQRILKPGAAVRLIVPSLEYAIHAYRDGNLSHLPEWPERYGSIGGRFNNFLLCSNQHKIMFDFGFLEELLKGCGFSRVYREQANRSDYFSRDHLQFESDPSIIDSSLFVEAIK
ncbi:MAG: methyltransferase domain-containing protein [Deltaproteobacteria bacterium]|nr:methyltransferase domain-containing protein [Deltaproteobacteria bacterium]